SPVSQVIASRACRWAPKKMVEKVRVAGAFADGHRGGNLFRSVGGYVRSGRRVSVGDGGHRDAPDRRLGGSAAARGSFSESPSFRKLAHRLGNASSRTVRCLGGSFCGNFGDSADFSVDLRIFSNISVALRSVHWRSRLCHHGSGASVGACGRNGGRVYLFRQRL